MVRKTIITLITFVWGMITTVLAAAVYDANIQSRANKIFDTIRSNASIMDPLDIPAYYSLVRMNVASLMQVLTLVDDKIDIELWVISWQGDGGLLGDITGAGNTGTIIPPSTWSASTDPLCKNTLLVWNLRICDTGKKSTYQNMKRLCPPDGSHVPNYWEMKYIFDSGIKLDISKNGSYYTSSLYGSIMKSTDYPYNSHPYYFTNGGYMNHTSWWTATNDTLNILCINHAGVPTSDPNGVKYCEITQNLLNIGVTGKYKKENIARNNLFEWETIALDSLGNEINKWNIDYTLSLSCKGSQLTKNETIKKINSCKYGYVLVNNDCKIDPTVCNLENLWNVHPTNSKVCSWKEIGKKEFQNKTEYAVWGIKKFQWYSVGDSDAATEIKNNWDQVTKNEVLQEYRSLYNNKVDIQVQCEVKTEWHNEYTLTYICNTNGLFWQ